MSGEVLHGVARADQLHERANISFLCGINRACALSSGTLRCSLYGILRSALNGEEEHRHINYDQGKNRLHETASAGETLCGFPTLVIVNKQGWRERASKDSSVGSLNCPPLLYFRAGRKLIGWVALPVRVGGWRTVCYDAARWHKPKLLLHRARQPRRQSLSAKRAFTAI